MNYSKKREYWEKTAKQQKKIGSSLTHSDSFLPILERKAISKYISKKNKVLEIGCGACDNSIDYMRNCKEYVGVELIQDFVELSKRKIIENGVTNAVIIQDDGLKYVSNNEIDYDLIITQRFIINLRDRKAQKDFLKAIKENAKNKNLRLVFCEGFEKELGNLNKLREIGNLEPIQVAEYNNFLGPEFYKVIKEVGFKINEEVTFNTFFFVTRLFNSEKYAKQNSQTADFAFNLEFGNYVKINNEISYSKVIVLDLNENK